MSTLPESKRCTKCGERKPAEDFYVKDRGTGRLYSWCKLCHKAMNLPKDAAEVERRRAQKVEYYETHKDEYRERKRKWEAANRERMNATAKKWREAHPEKVKASREANAEKTRARMAEYRERTKEHRREYNQAYYRAHKDQVRARIRACNARRMDDYLAACARWKKANVERSRAHAHKRRTLISESETHYTPREWFWLKVCCGRACMCCGATEPDVKLTVDHVVPVSRGGSNGIENIACLCFDCNNRKNASTRDYRPEHIKALFARRK